jgi:DNA-binding MarR family transcriptional regulator
VRSHLDASDYRTLEEFRYQLRCFLAFSEAAAQEAGIEPQQHQALLALKAAPAGVPPTVGHIAARLLLKHHSAVGLVNRLEASGLVARESSNSDARQVLVKLTPIADRLLQRLSLAHRTELEATGPRLAAALRTVNREARDRTTQ